jgi:hypothetical protein
MAEWASCRHCGLTHSRRPDGTCPRCHKGIDSGERDGAVDSTLTPLAASPKPGWPLWAKLFVGAVVVPLGTWFGARVGLTFTGSGTAAGRG